MSRKERIILFTLAAVNFTHIIDFMIMMPLGPQFMEIFRISPQQFSLAVSAYSISAGISGFAAAFFADRYNRKTMLLFAYTGFVVGTFACALAPNYPLLLAARLLAGLFGGMISAQVLSIVGDTFPYERRAQAMSYIIMAFSVASVVGVPLGLKIADVYSWHAPFTMVGCLGAVVIAMLWQYLPDMNGHISHEDRSESRLQNATKVITDVLHDKNQLTALLCSAIMIVGHFSIIPFITPYLVSNLGFRQDNVFLIYLVGGALTIFTSPMVGRLADIKGKVLVYMVFASLSLIPNWLITHLWAMPLWATLAITGMLFVTSNGRSVPLQAMMSGVVTASQRGSFMSINASVQQLSIGLASLISGLIVSVAPDGRLEHYDIVGYFSMLLVGLSVLVARRIKVVS